MSPLPRNPMILRPEQWCPAETRHRQRTGRYTGPYLARRSAGKKHPVEDFLFTYYTHKPGQLLRWHPGAGVVLAGELAAERTQWKYYRRLTDDELAAAGLGAKDTAVVVDQDAFLAERGAVLGFTRTLLGASAARPGQFGCFGLHEWAMVYRLGPQDVRHEYLGLRLGADGTNDVVEANRIRCSHFDAFRFFTPHASGRNELRPTRATQQSMEQPGCLHANMDLYKWAYKLAPVLPSELVMDCFELAWRIRELDMRASPYDLAEWGYAPVMIETPAGKAAYTAAQRRFSAESQLLRRRLLLALEVLDQSGPAGEPPHQMQE